MPAKKKSSPKEEKTAKKKTTKKTTKKAAKKTTKKAAKKESEEKTEDSKEDKKAKLEALKAKAEALAAGIDTKEIDVSKEVRKEQKPGALAPIEDFLKSSIHLGTRAITPDMKPYVYKRRADSLAVFNTELLDDKLKEGGEYLAQYAPEDVVVVCKRDAGDRAVSLFSEVTGINVFVKNYPAGILTNPNLENFMEKELLVICDPWTDKAALADAKRVKMKVMAICDTNNYTMNIDKVVPGNNKSAKSLGFIFYILAKIYVKERKIDTEVPPISEWVENWDTLTPPK